MKNLLLGILLLFSVSTFSQNIYGLGSDGGAYNGGLIYGSDIQFNTAHVLLDFLKNNGSHPLYAKHIKINDSTLLGVAEDVIYSINTITKEYKIEFALTNSVLHGERPKELLFVESLNKIYGSTQDGGINDDGILYEYNFETKEFTKLFDFNETIHGSNPRANLVYKNGFIYGATFLGGQNGNGVLFKYDIANSNLIPLFNFGSPDGQRPSGLIEFGQYLYGITYRGGTNLAGTIFKFHTGNSVLTTVHDFGGGVEGYNPYGNLTNVGDSVFYGLTVNGGEHDLGVLYKYSTNGDFNILVSFDSTLGANPIGYLTYKNGYLFGATTKGGENDKGVLFKYNIFNNQYTLLKSFESTLTGSTPYSNITFVNDSILYSTCYDGGAANSGTVYSYNLIQDTIEVFAHLNYSVSGCQPRGEIAVVSDNTVVGVTEKGGLNNLGVIYSFNTLTRVYTKLFDFSESSGYSCNGGLMLASNHKIYGLNYSGGEFGKGTMFEFDLSSSTYTIIRNFTGLSGENPSSVLLEYNNVLYGATKYGGTSNDGMLFKYALITSAFDTLFSFEANTSGASATFGLTLDYQNKIWGINRRNIFKLDPETDSVFVTYSLSNYPLLSSPKCKLIEVDETRFCFGSHGSDDSYLTEYNRINNTVQHLIPVSFLSNNSLFKYNNDIYGSTYADNYKMVFKFNFNNNELIEVVNLLNVVKNLPLESPNIVLCADESHQGNIYEVCNGDSILLGNRYYTSTQQVNDTIYGSCGNLNISNHSVIVREQVELPVILGSDHIQSNLIYVFSSELDTNYTYLWNYNGELVSQVSSDSLFLLWPANGQGYVSLTMEDNLGCQSVTDTLFVTIGTTNLTEQTEAINVYPNPASNTLSIEHTEIINEIIIYDLLGKILFHNIAIDNQHVNIDVSILMQGTYILSINQKQKVLFVKNDNMTY